MKKAINSNLVNIAILLIIIFFLYQTKNLWASIINLLRPFFLAFVISYLINPLIRLLSKKINKKIAGVIIIIITGLIFFLLLKVTIPLISRELPLLYRELIVFTKNISLKYNMSFFADNFSDLFNKLIDYVSNDLINILTKSVSVITEAITIIILSIYFTFNYDKLKTIISSYLINNNNKIYNLLKNINKELSSYLNGIGIIMLVEIIEYTIIYYLIGHPNYLLLAFLASVTTVIPFFGGLITNTVALISASVISKELFFLTAIVVVLMPVIDSYFIQPKIYKKTNSLPPMLTIIIVIIGGTLFKIVGVMIAIPLYIVIKNLAKLTINYK